ncbi:hypothetical protein LOTGIDRAFT_127723 [Lottia gigantea]|uniref:G-protein coupled receptors family 1 profile domain-containing protein n=1 Tax=Lottia gigantea TaxID=225164 RepID=V3Z9I6_LOTGI|nr:hypothetical protein LOTGIDRAFT_127723 [Lottia gigantea]ESO87583.1 hypothetical protein LOTGIDRAFT_127723 [Lottia gigantea]
MFDNITGTTPYCKYKEGDQCYYSDEHLLEQIYAFLKPHTHEWIYCVIFILVFIFGVTGNSLVCFAVWRNVHLRTTTNLFLVNLAVADLLVLILCLPPTFAQTFWETWFLGDVMCKIVEFYQSVSVIVSVFTLTAISVERWFAICRPMSFKEKRKHVIITIGVIWLVGHLASLPRLIIFTATPDQMIPVNLTVLLTSCTPEGYPRVAYINELVCLVLFYLLPIIVMGYTYLSIAICLWSSNICSSLKPHRQNKISMDNLKLINSSIMSLHDKVTSQLKARRRVAKMLIVVVIVFILCFLPVYIWNILRHPIVHQTSKTSSAIGYTVHLLIYINSSINPVIYNFMSGKF